MNYHKAIMYYSHKKWILIIKKHHKRPYFKENDHILLTNSYTHTSQRLSILRNIKNNVFSLPSKINEKSIGQ